MFHKLFPLASLLLVVPTAAQTVWTVKPDGTGDFLNVQAAVDAASSGDVLLISPFPWGDLVISKSLTLLGDPNQPRPTFESLYFVSTERFTVSHLAPVHLQAVNVSSRSFVDDCVIETVSLGAEFDVTISRSSIGGAAAAETAFPTVSAYGGAGLEPKSQLRVVDSQIVGSAGLAHDGLPGVGAPGVFAQFADVWVSGSSITGGSGQDLGGLPGSGGAALACNLDGRVEVRGSSFDALTGGPHDPGALGAPPSGLAIDVQPLQLTAIASGVALVGGVSPGVSVVAPRPYLEITGTDGPGGVRRIDLYGPAAPGNLAVVALSMAPAFDPSTIAAWSAPLEIDVGQVIKTFALVPQGQDAPASTSIPLPSSPTLIGVSAHAQGLALDGAGPWWLTSSTAIHISF